MKSLFFLFFLVMNIVIIAFPDEYDEVKALLTAEEGGDITFLSKINLGFPGGDNWIATRSERRSYVYTVNRTIKEVKRVDSVGHTKQSDVRYYDTNSRSYVDLDYDVMRGLSGTQIGDMAAIFGDYNGDDMDEIFIFNPWNEPYCSVRGYDPDKGRLESCFGCTFVITDPAGPPPAAMINYEGVDGIIVQSIKFREETTTWNFFVWDEESRRFVVKEEIPDADFDHSLLLQTPWEITEDDTNDTKGATASTGVVSDEQEEVIEETVSVPPAVVNEPEPANESEVENAAMPFTITPETEHPSRFPLLLVFAGLGAVLLGVIIAVIVAKRKKKERT